MTDVPSAPADRSSNRFAHSCWTPARKQLLEWLESKARSSAELYETAVSLMYIYSLPGRLRFVSHAVREIRNRLPDAVSGVESGYLSYHNRVDAIAREWPIDNAGSGVTAVTSNGDIQPEETVRVDRPLYLMWDRLITDHVASKSRTTQAALRLFSGIAPENEGRRDELRPLATAWVKVTRWFESRAHDSGVIVDEGELLHHFQLFENSLIAAVGHISRSIEELDEILAVANR